MPLLPLVKTKFQELADRFIERHHQPRPTPDRLRRCKIVSHRGEHGNNPLEENTIAAFDRAAKAGVWGIELDIRFTADGEPMVFHDACLSRVYGRPHHIADLTASDINHRFPGIPTLADVVERFGQTQHLMIEVKQQAWPHPTRQNGRFRDILSSLEPAVDYHLLCLHPRALTPVEGVPPQARIVISEYWPEVSRYGALNRKWGGLCGHFLLLRRGVIRSLQAKGLKVGTGYVRSRNGLYREINRGVDWIFSNEAKHLQQLVDTALSTDSHRG